mgnify:CR=1 FL=1
MLSCKIGWSCCKCIHQSIALARVFLLHGSILMLGGKRGSRPYSAQKGLFRVEACTEVLYTCVMKGRIESHVVCNGSMNAVSCLIVLFICSLGGDMVMKRSIECLIVWLMVVIPLR